MRHVASLHRDNLTVVHRSEFGFIQVSTVCGWVGGSVSECVPACVCACVRACVRACVCGVGGCACVGVCMGRGGRVWDVQQQSGLLSDGECLDPTHLFPFKSTCWNILSQPRGSGDADLFSSNSRPNQTASFQAWSRSEFTQK